MNFPNPGGNNHSKPAAELGVEKKLLLANLAHNSLTDLSSLINQVIKGSQSSATLSNTHKSLASLDPTIEGTATNINKFNSILDQLNSQEQIIEKSVKKTKVVRSQLESINKVPLRRKHSSQS